MDVFKYPKFGRIEQVLPNPDILLGHEIWWTIKEDGSNFGIYYDDEGKIRVRSRNFDVAKFEQKVQNVPTYKRIVEMMEHQKLYHLNPIVFGELLYRGTSPTGLVKQRPKDDLIIFDIYDRTHEKFLNWPQVCLMCEPFDVPVVKTVGKCVCSTLEQLESFKNEMMEASKGTEGVVGKIYQKPYDLYPEPFLFVKEKHAYPKPERVFVDNTKPKLPQLPETDVRACVQKVKDELSEEDFKTMKIVMPRIAEKVAEECREQNCSNSIKLSRIYFDYLNNGVNP